MRVYVAATLPRLGRWRAAGELGPPPVQAYTVTPSLREWYAVGDTEELEYAALTDAAGASLRLLADEPDAPRRRVVVAVDMPDSAVRLGNEDDRSLVRLDQPVPWQKVAAVHVDAGDAVPAVAAAAAALPLADAGDEDAQFAVGEAEGHELQWYATQEVPQLLGEG